MTEASGATPSVATIQTPMVKQQPKSSFWPKLPAGSIRSLTLIFLMIYQPILAEWFPNHTPNLPYQICNTLGIIAGVFGLTRAYASGVMAKLAAWGQGANPPA
jgi:hypothetical protein